MKRRSKKRKKKNKKSGRKETGELIQGEIFTFEVQNYWIRILSCGMTNHTWSMSWVSCLLTKSRRCYPQQTSFPKKMDTNGAVRTKGGYGG